MCCKSFVIATVAIHVVRVIRLRSLVAENDSRQQLIDKLRAELDALRSSSAAGAAAVTPDNTTAYNACESDAGDRASLVTVAFNSQLVVSANPSPAVSAPSAATVDKVAGPEKHQTPRPQQLGKTQTTPQGTFSNSSDPLLSPPPSAATERSLPFGQNSTPGRVSSTQFPSPATLPTPSTPSIPSTPSQSTPRKFGRYRPPPPLPQFPSTPTRSPALPHGGPLKVSPMQRFATPPPPLPPSTPTQHSVTPTQALVAARGSHSISATDPTTPVRPQAIIAAAAVPLAQGHQSPQLSIDEEAQPQPPELPPRPSSFNLRLSGLAPEGVQLGPAEIPRKEQVGEIKRASWAQGAVPTNDDSMRQQQEQEEEDEKEEEEEEEMSLVYTHLDKDEVASIHA